MIFGCLPHLGHVVEFLKHFGKRQPESLESHERNASSLESSSPSSPSLPRTTLPSNGRSLETIRLLLDTVTNNHFFPPSPRKPIITTSDYGYGSINSIERLTPSSHSHLVPPSPVRSISESSESGDDSIISNDDLTGSGASSFSNEDISSRPDLDSGSPLEDSLISARREWPEGETRYFLPANAIEKFITVESIEEELKRSRARLLSGQSRYQVAAKILQLAPRLFCILVFVQKVCFISDFLQEDIDDSALPFSRDDKKRRSGNFRLCNKLFPNEPLQCMSHWKSKWIKDFSREQWSVMTPNFKDSDSIQHYKFDDNSVFPFTRDEERNHVKEGGFGTVWELEIHPAHHSFYSKVLNPSFALKRLHSRSRHFFESEVKMLKHFSENRQHDHLIKLFATYEFKGSFYLLFPYAKSDLRDYWKQTSLPEFSRFTVKWALRQCKGIASAVQTIHGYRTTFDALESLATVQSAADETNLGFTDPNERLYSCHGDIKPENILWSDEDSLDKDAHFNEQGILLIADFGLMKCHKTRTEFRITPEQARGSAPYEPPEVAEPRISKVSRSYDIWSLGCVYLEFVTWLVCGFAALEHFREARSKGTDDETFFTLIDDGISGHPRNAILKKSVQDLIDKLQNEPRCSEFIREFLNLISGDMLVPNPKERIHCGPLNEKLTNMVGKAKEDSSYLVRRWGTSTVVSTLQDGSPLPKRPSVANKL